jgi:LEA14-like dessication related protein
VQRRAGKLYQRLSLTAKIKVRTSGVHRAMNGTRTATLFVGLAMLSACIPKFYEPELRLETVRLGALGFRGGTLYARIVVANPNSYELRSATIRYTIAMNDASADERTHWLDVATGSIDHEVRVAAGDSVSVEVPVDFSYAGIGGAIRTVLATGSFEYRLTGDLRVIAPIRRSIPFRQSGKVDVISAWPDLE